MGRIKTSMVKRVTLELVRNYKSDFKKSFDENKEVLQGKAEIPSKKLRNVIAGYVTRLMKRKEEI
jgi:small subunit ribosomal protein S17e